MLGILFGILIILGTMGLSKVYLVWTGKAPSQYVILCILLSLTGIGIAALALIY
jgi:hypothetical protein